MKEAVAVNTESLATPSWASVSGEWRHSSQPAQSPTLESMYVLLDLVG